MYTSPSQSHLTSDHQYTRSLTPPPDYTRNASFRANRAGSRPLGPALSCPPQPPGQSDAATRASGVSQYLSCSQVAVAPASRHTSAIPLADSARSYAALESVKLLEVQDLPLAMSRPHSLVLVSCS